MVLPPFVVRWLVIAGVVVAAYGIGRLHQALADEREHDQQILQSWRQGDKHVAKYLQRIDRLADESVVARRLERVCRGQLRSAGRTDAAPQADADDRRADDQRQRLAGELKACADNAAKLDELQSVLRPQVDR